MSSVVSASKFLEPIQLAQFQNLRNTNDRFEAFTQVGGSWHGQRNQRDIFRILDKIFSNCFTLDSDDEDTFYPYLLVFHAQAEDIIKDSVSASVRRLLDNQRFTIWSIDPSKTLSGEFSCSLYLGFLWSADTPVALFRRPRGSR